MGLESKYNSRKQSGIDIGIVNIKTSNTNPSKAPSIERTNKYHSVSKGSKQRKYERMFPKLTDSEVKTKDDVLTAAFNTRSD